MTQSNTEMQAEKLYVYLQKKYKRAVISKSEMAEELGISNSTLDLYIAKGTGLPNYKKLGKAKNAKVVFNLIDVAEFLSQTIKTL
ncbi:MAG: helix-turn-helix transcriptional regulator [Sulfurospirillum sp.]|jgi:predicted DNA-binding transcriptional regulator AlpA